MAGKGSGAKGTGRNPAQARSQVTRAARTGAEQRDPGPVGSQAAQSRQTAAKPGQQATRATRPDGSTRTPPDLGRGVQDRSSAATGSSIFEKADARNRMLGRRNRPTA